MELSERLELVEKINNQFIQIGSEVRIIVRPFKTVKEAIETNKSQHIICYNCSQNTILSDEELLEVYKSNSNNFQTHFEKIEEDNIYNDIIKRVRSVISEEELNILLRRFGPRA